MENSDSRIQTGKIDIDKNGQNIESVVKYEQAFNNFFKELGLKPSQTQLIRAFIDISKGQINFEASANDLANILYKKNTNGFQKNRGKVSYALKVLAKWQEENKVELIRIIQKGRRKINDSGHFEYTKTQYEFVALKDLVTIPYSDSQDLETLIEKVLAKIRANYEPVKKPKNINARNKLRIAKNTIITKLKRVFGLSIEASLNPVGECQKVLDDSQEILDEMAKDWIEENERESFISEFENLMNTDETVEAAVNDEPVIFRVTV